jgi:hypothetical protein
VQVHASDLHVPVLGQLASAQLSLRDALKPGPLEVIRLDTPFGRWPLCQQTLEDALRDPYHPTVFSTPNSTARRSSFQRASSGKVKNMGVSGREALVFSIRSKARMQIGFLSSLCPAAGPRRILARGLSKKGRGIVHR